VSSSGAGDFLPSEFAQGVFLAKVRSPMVRSAAAFSNAVLNVLFRRIRIDVGVPDTTRVVASMEHPQSIRNGAMLEQKRRPCSSDAVVSSVGANLAVTITKRGRSPLPALSQLWPMLGYRTIFVHLRPKAFGEVFGKALRLEVLGRKFRTIHSICSLRLTGAGGHFKFTGLPSPFQVAMVGVVNWMGWAVRGSSARPLLKGY
jgi:hypothetical protein